MWYFANSAHLGEFLVPCQTTFVEEFQMNIKKTICILISLLVSNFCLAEETIGVEEKVKKAYELYLQDQSVTLSSQQWRVGIDLSYTSDEKTVLFNHQESRNVVGSLSANYGVTDNIEIFAQIPVVYSHTKSEDVFGQTSENNSSINLGNIIIGGNATIFKFANGPTMTLQTNFSLPTNTNNSATNKSAITAGVTLYQDFDPAFLYGGVYGTKTISGDIFDGFSYQAGFGFSLNHRLAIGAEVSGGYRFTPQLMTSGENAFLTGRATFSLNKNNIIQPSISFGLNDSSPDYSLNLNWTRRF